MAKRKTTSNPQPDAAYTVLARRYRPQQFADLIGQEHVAQALANALANNRVAHAYLFTGARGVGKTSTARILAKALNCEKGPTATPCDQCEPCRAISAGDDVDVLEIDGASNRGIDEVRDIRQNVQYRPSRSRHKIYIIDEVHMLTAAAFNALLKTLEEPPNHVKFIFATTEVQKIPITILSRCQRFDFAGIGSQGIVDRLKKIIADEKTNADDDALLAVAKRAGGSMRDAQSLLDQLLAFGSDKLTLNHVNQLLGAANDERITELADAVANRDAKTALQLLDAAVAEGVHLGELLGQMTQYWRDLMIVGSAGVEPDLLSVAKSGHAKLKQHADSLGLDAIMAGLEILSTAKGRMRNSGHGRVLTEMAIVRLCRLDDLVSLSQLAQLLSQAPASGTVTHSPPKNEPEKRSLSAAFQKKNGNDAPAAAVEETEPRTEDVPLEQLWKQVTEKEGRIGQHELAKIERVAISGPNSLAIHFPPGYNVSDHPTLSTARLKSLEASLREITGRMWTVEIAKNAAADETASQPAPASARQVREEASKLPLVAKAMESLGAQIMKIDDLFGVPANSDDASPTEES